MIIFAFTQKFASSISSLQCHLLHVQQKTESNTQQKLSVKHHKFKV